MRLSNLAILSAALIASAASFAAPKEQRSADEVTSTAHMAMYKQEATSLDANLVAKYNQAVYGNSSTKFTYSLTKLKPAKFNELVSKDYVTSVYRF